jgi:ribulose-phosphate 3-epimerase
VASLSADGPAILPSLLLCDFANLQQEIARLEDAGIRAYHLDVMDGHFVPNLTYGFPIVEAVRRLTPRPIDTHLMIAEPGRYVARFVEAGADVVTIHAEAVGDPRPVLQEIRKRGARAGLAINPATPAATVEPYLDDCDLVLVMSVEAGFGGQQFRPSALGTLRRLRKVLDERPRVGDAERIVLEVDGGINEATIGPSAEAGADLCVVGSAIFGHDDYRTQVQRLAAEARQGWNSLARLAQQ